MFKRIILFMLVNVLVMVTISIVLSLLGVGRYITAQGLDYGQLAAFCLIWGFGGAFISLGLSRIMAKWMMGVRVIDPNQASTQERALQQMVHELASRAGLRVMPQVGIYESPELNAFATGPTKNRALVAVSTGLLSSMSRDELEGVLGHEIAHVANGDMVTMTLLQGVVNAFVMFFARVIAFAVSQNAREENRRMINMVVTIACEVLLSFLGMMVVAYFSRYREFRADKGSAQYAGRQKMILALERLRSQHEPLAASPAIDTLKITGRHGILSLLSTHPPLESRIAALREA